jgi:heme exporter protein A
MRHVLAGVSFDLEAGTCMQVTGRNGAGKTTLLRTVCGLLPSEEGEVLWNGRSIEQDASAYRSSLGYLGHDAPLKGDLTATENLRYSVGLRRRLAPSDVAAALARVNAAAFADRPVRTLSAGQRRRVALGALWLMAVPLWVMDEPNTNLDAAGQDLVSGLIEERLAQGGLVLAAVHQKLALPAARSVDLVLGRPS